MFMPISSNSSGRLMTEFTGLTLGPGPRLTAHFKDYSTEKTYEEDVTAKAGDYLTTPVTVVSPTLGDVIRLVQLNPLLVQAIGRRRDYVVACVERAFQEPSPSRKRYQPPSNCGIVLSSSLEVNSTTKEMDCMPTLHLHAEHPADPYTMQEFGLFGLHVQDLTGLPIRYEPSMELLEADCGKLTYGRSLGTLQRPQLLLAEFVRGCFQEFTYRDSALPRGIKLEDEALVEGTLPCEPHALIHQVLEAPYPEECLHRSIINAIFFYIKDDEMLADGLRRTHTGLEVKLQPAFKHATGYQARKVIYSG